MCDEFEPEYITCYNKFSKWNCHPSSIIKFNTYPEIICEKWPFKRDSADDQIVRDSCYINYSLTVVQRKSRNALSEIAIFYLLACMLSIAFFIVAFKKRITIRNRSPNLNKFRYTKLRNFNEDF